MTTSISGFFRRLYDIVAHDFVDTRPINRTGQIKEAVEKNLQSVDEVSKSADHLRDLARVAYHRLKNLEMIMGRRDH